MVNQNLEDLTRSVIKALQGEHIISEGFSLENLRNDHRFGFRIYAITEGPGKHTAEVERNRNQTTVHMEHHVPDGQVFATTQEIASGYNYITTYIFNREADGKLKLIGDNPLNN